MEFTEILREFLTLNNMSQTDFAKRIGIKQSQVSEWLKGKAKPGYDMLRKMAVEFDMSADYFLGIANNP